LRGFILKLQRAKNEDLIVKILSENSIESYYRFYGARHSILQLGYLIDFEEEKTLRNFMPNLRRVRHLSFNWLYAKERLIFWHQFIILLERHLRDARDISPFYFELLLESAKRLEKQNPKRVICESYYKILKYEGRLHLLKNCYICEEPLGRDITLMRALIPACTKCLFGATINKERLNSFITSGKTIFLEDFEVDFLYSVILKGF